MKEKFPQSEQGIPQASLREREAFKETLRQEKERLEGELKKVYNTLQSIERAEGAEVVEKKETYTYDELMELGRKAGLADKE